MTESAGHCLCGRKFLILEFRFQTKRHLSISFIGSPLQESVSGVNRLTKIGEKYYRLPTKREKNYRFAADVIHLCKLSVRHVGAHLRCEISCKYIAISTVPSFKYFVLWTFPVKKIQNQKRIFSLGYLCF